ncbi:MAG: 7-carboxy-7-deazaguanine synthase QueE [Gammaproteobacteria bacterium]|nr:7-carboxy-7-deazaguanine synthase QueE [Gammaproteobacteria bacterium]
MGQDLRITEIFYSLQGETRSMGLPTVFVRLTGCPLRCRYCDTAYAFSGGTRWSEEAILQEVGAYSASYVTVTGGEPLAQPAVLSLMYALCEQGYTVSVETSGALSIAGIDSRVSVILDIKTPGSGEEARNDYANLTRLKPIDQVKFVLTDRKDYEWSRTFIADHGLHERCEVLLSAVAGVLPPADLADWILADRLPVRFQLQLHKVLWGDVRGR